MLNPLRNTLSIAALVWFSLAAPAPLLADESSGHVVDAAAITARIDQKAGDARADLATIQDLLGRPEVRQIAGSAGLDLDRASARAALLSDAERHDLAVRAAPVLDQIGGTEHIVLSVTAVIIILLILILILD